MKQRFFIIATLICAGFYSAPASAQTAFRDRLATPKLSSPALLTEIQRRAVRFFWEESDSATGLTNDRARNRTEDSSKVASIASTGYALAALPIAVEHHWLSRPNAYARALLTLRFLKDKMPQEHGWYYHFVDRNTGTRIWKCELSSIDTALLLTGALLCAQYWHGTEVSRLANFLYSRIDWTWMRTNGGTQPDKQLLSHGWKPEEGFLRNNWDQYCELMLLYLLGLGAERNSLPDASWTAWKRNVITYGGHTTLTGGPIFLHQMAQIFYNFHNQRDRAGWNYWTSSQEATGINRQYCLDKAPQRKTYAPDIWGLNACDFPDGYKAFAAPGDEDGTVSPTGATASLLFTPQISIAAAQAMYTRYGNRIWGRYGFSDAFNVDRNWYDPDVIGIDLGMVLLAIEDYETGMPWKLLAAHPGLRRAWKRAGFHPTASHALYLREPTH